MQLRRNHLLNRLFRRDEPLLAAPHGLAGILTEPAAQREVIGYAGGVFSCLAHVIGADVEKTLYRCVTNNVFTLVTPLFEVEEREQSNLAQSREPCAAFSFKKLEAIWREVARRLLPRILRDGVLKIDRNLAAKPCQAAIDQPALTDLTIAG